MPTSRKSDKPGRDERAATLHPSGGAAAQERKDGTVSLLEGLGKVEAPSAAAGGAGVQIPAEVVAAAKAILLAPADRFGTTSTPAPSKGVARSTAYALRVALTAEGVFTKTWSRPATEDKEGPYHWAVIRITEEDYRKREENFKRNR